MKESQTEKLKRNAGAHIDGALERIELLEAQLYAVKLMVQSAKENKEGLNKAIESLYSALSCTADAYNPYSALSAFRDHLRDSIEALEKLEKLECV
jgi:hypothetical protein